VVGRSKPRYHLFGAAVDIVQELEQEGDVGGVVVSDSAARAIGLSKIGIVDDKKLFSVWGSINQEMIKDAVITLEDHR
jgi:class 3 adenylate cyclase